jgi:hypothetical protein
VALFVFYILSFVLRLLLSFVEFMTRFSIVSALVAWSNGESMLMLYACVYHYSNTSKCTGMGRCAACLAISAILHPPAHTSRASPMQSSTTLSRQVFMSMTGQNFHDSAHSAVSLMKRNGLDSFGMWWLPPFILQVRACAVL